MAPGRVLPRRSGRDGRVDTPERPSYTTALLGGPGGPEPVALGPPGRQTGRPTDVCLQGSLERQLERISSWCPDCLSVVITTDRKGPTVMKRSTPVVALSLLLLAGARANADFIQWSYNWNINPISVLSDSGNGSVSFTNQPAQTASGNSDTVATNLKANSLAAPSSPDTLLNTGAYALTLALTDATSGQSGTAVVQRQVERHRSPRTAPTSPTPSPARRPRRCSWATTAIPSPSAPTRLPDRRIRPTSAASRPTSTSLRTSAASAAPPRNRRPCCWGCSACRARARFSWRSAA